MKIKLVAEAVLLTTFVMTSLIGGESALAASPSKQQIERALEFVITKDMGKKLNAIQWTMKAGSEGRPILSGNHYQLVNMAINRGLKRQKRVKAAHLGFLKESSKEFNMLVKRAKGNGQLRYGDTIALSMKSYGAIRYKKQGKYGGINLGSGKKGKKVFSGMPFALYNLKPIKTEVIFCLRTRGIDLGWRGKSKCGGVLAKASGKVFGANGALSGDGLSGKLKKKWKDRLCKAAVGAAATYLTGQTGGAGAAGVAAAAPKAIKKCNKL
jgi:hypothetical protein